MRMSAEPFLDTNVIVYLVSADERKADISEKLVASGATVSVQALNEFASVASRKLSMPLEEIADVLAAVRSNCEVQPLTVELHDVGIGLMRRYSLSVYHAMIGAAALMAGNKTLMSDGLQDGLVIDDSLRVVNPYRC